MPLFCPSGMALSAITNPEPFAMHNNPQAQRAALLDTLGTYFDSGRFVGDLARRVAWHTESDMGEPSKSFSRYSRVGNW